MKISFNILKIALVALFFTSLPSHVLCSDLIQIEYDLVTDNLTLKAENAKLDGVLALVSHKTGIFIRIDPSIEKRITTELNDTDLESALRQLSKGLNHAMTYESQNNGEDQRLIGIEILRNDSAYGQDSRFYTRTNTRFLTDHGLNDNGSPQPDPDIYNHYTVNHARIGSQPDTIPEQSFDIATTKFSSKVEDTAASEVVEKKSFVDSDTEPPCAQPQQENRSSHGSDCHNKFCQKKLRPTSDRLNSRCILVISSQNPTMFRQFKLKFLSSLSLRYFLLELSLIKRCSFKHKKFLYLDISFFEVIFKLILIPMLHFFLFLALICSHQDWIRAFIPRRRFYEKIRNDCHY